VLFRRHRTSFRHIIPLPATQWFPAEVPAGSRPGLVNGTAPFPDSAAIRLLFAQVPARGIGKEITVRFLQAPLAEVMQLVGFALPDENEREPSAAFAAAAAGTGGREGWLRFHTTTQLDRNRCKDTESPQRYPASGRSKGNRECPHGEQRPGIRKGNNRVPARFPESRGGRGLQTSRFREPRYPSAGSRHTSGAPGPRPHPQQTP